MRVGAGPGFQLETWLMWSAHPLGAAVCRVPGWYPAFAPGSSRGAAGFWVFLYLFVHNLPQLSMQIAIFSPVNFSLYFVAQEDICPGASTQQRVPGPSLSHHHTLSFAPFLLDPFISPSNTLTFFNSFSSILKSLCPSLHPLRRPPTTKFTFWFSGD